VSVYNLFAPAIILPGTVAALLGRQASGRGWKLVPKIEYISTGDDEHRDALLPVCYAKLTKCFHWSFECGMCLRDAMAGDGRQWSTPSRVALPLFSWHAT